MRKDIARDFLHNRESIYEKILFSLPDIIFIFDEKGNFIEFNTENQEALFLKPGEFIGKNILDTNLPENIKKTTYKIIDHVLKTKKEKKFRYELNMQNESAHFEARFFLLEPNKVFSIIRDIGSIKKIEQTQKELRQYYQSILERTEHGIIETDINGKIEFVNNSFLKISKISKQTLFSTNFFTLFGLQKEKKELDRILLRLEKTGINQMTFETNKVFSNNKEGYARINIAGYKCFKNKCLKLNIDVQDITEANKQKLLLSKSESTYRSLVEYSPNGILIRSDKKILYANPKAIQMFGFKSLQEMTNFNIENLFLPEYGPIIAERLQSLKEGKPVSYIEIKIRRPSDGKIIEIETIPALIYFEGSEAYQIVIKDISIQKKLLETQLRANLAEENYLKLREEIIVRQQMEQELSQSLKEKEVLLKEVHHRVKNNLQIISSILNLEIKTEKHIDTELALKRIQSRINSIYLVHEIVYQTDMYSRIHFGNYIRLISETMIRSYKYIDIEFRNSFEDVYLSLDYGVPCGMIINELFYGLFEQYSHFKENSHINISLKQDKNNIKIEILFPEQKNTETKLSIIETSLSSQLLDALTDQINGTHKMVKDSSKRMKFILHFQI